MGVGTTRVLERVMASRGLLEKTPVRFEASEGVDYGGVLFLLPALTASGLLSYRQHYHSLSGYYDLDSIILSLAFMYLCRIKNPEQLKHISPGEFGKLLGLDRIPEAKKLREKIHRISDQKQAESWNRSLAQQWVEDEDCTFYYIDGHVKVYSGNKANLGKKHIARLKLCLPGITEFWVNNGSGLPYFVVTGEVNEKMQEMITTKILPELFENVAIKVSEQELEANPELPRFTLVFDREVSSPKFFGELWTKYRVAVVTYKKNVKDKWPATDFEEHIAEIDANEVKMKLCEKNIEMDGVSMREIRKENTDQHQTSIITTNMMLATIMVAIKMFTRWTQENFFKYLRADYDLDKIVHYVTNEINKDFKVVNPTYRKLTYQIKKTAEKISRRKAKLFDLINQNIKEDVDKTPENINKQSQLTEEIETLENQQEDLSLQRKEHPYKITIAEMQEEIRYNKLDIESKLLQNIIKMICYRAETSFSILLAVDYKKKTNEMRALTKSLINTKANIIPDYAKQTLTVQLYSLSCPRDNKAAKQICETLNQSQTKFPGTELVLIYEIATG